MKRHPRPGIALALLLALTLPCRSGQGDALSQPPGPWRDLLVPIAETDVSGAEPLMQTAIAEARGQVAALLAQTAPEHDALAQAYGRLGALYLLLEVETPADAALRNARKLQPDAFRWPYYAGYLAMLAGNLEQALVYLEAARAIDPNYPTLYLRLGKVRLDRSELAEARAALERVKDVDELASPANYYLGQIAILERRFDDAVVLLRAALAANPGATEVHYPLAQAYRALGESGLAREQLAAFKLRTPQVHDPLLEQLQGVTRRSLPAFEKAIHAVRDGDYAEAIEHFTKGLQVDPDNAAARVSYARVLYLAGQSDAAAEALASVRERDPDNVLAIFLQGVLAQQQGRTGPASEAYRRVLSLDPAHTGALFYLANLDFVAGRYAEAAERYRQVLAADASIPPARLLALVAGLRAGESEVAIAARLEGLTVEHPDDPQLRYALARLRAAAEDPAVQDPTAAMSLASALMLARPIPPHQRALALARAAEGQFEQAAEALQQLITMVGWMAPPAEQALMADELEAFQDHRLPRPAWPEGDPLLSPPPFDPIAPFRDYPAVAPY